MAIKGYLNEIKFVEVLRVIGKHSGRLGVWNFAESKQYECFFQDEQVIYLNYNGTNVTNVDEAKKIALELSSDSKSYFAFKDDALPVSNFPIVSVADLLEFTLSNTVGNLSDTDELPNILTKFETVNKISFPLQGDLEEFWNKAINMLHEGCAGIDICNAFDYSEREVQEALYKLRTTGLIKPIRVFKSVNPALRTKMLSRNLSKIANNRNGVQTAKSLPQRELVNSVPSVSEASFQDDFAESVAPVTPQINHLPPTPAYPVYINKDALSQHQNSAFENSNVGVQQSNYIPAAPVEPVHIPVADNMPFADSSFGSNPPVTTPSYENVMTEPQIQVVSSPIVETTNYNQPIQPVVKTEETNSAPITYNRGRSGLIKRMLNSLFGN